MKAILFRGKSVETNEWVYGSYILEKYGNTPYICYFEYGTFVNIKQVEVIPETVGEFTGMTDKNGTEIFEGDIIQTKSNYRLLIKYGEYIPNDFCQFKYKDRKSFGLFATDGKDDFQMSNCSYLFEVIGNIHDNPELLKGGVE